VAGIRQVKPRKLADGALVFNNCLACAVGKFLSLFGVMASNLFF